MQYIIARIKEEYQSGGMSYLDTIQELEKKCQMTSREAEYLVDLWLDEMV
jgi:hypothetical protein